MAPDNSTAYTKSLLSVYLPLSWKTPRPSPPLRNHLPIDAVPHRPIAFTGDLSKMLRINTHVLPEISALLPPQSLMTSTYSALKKWVREALIEDWSQLFPLPAYDHHHLALHPHLFMGLGKFMAGYIHQMRAGKSYLAAHPSWRAREPDTSCPHCGLQPESFEHAILTWLSIHGTHTRLLHGVMDVSYEAPLWSSLYLEGSLPKSASPPLVSLQRCSRPTLPPPPRTFPSLPPTGSSPFSSIFLRQGLKSSVLRFLSCSLCRLSFL